jgi:hypothetical protein
MAEKRPKAAENGSLSARQEKALVALLACPTHEMAAKQAGIGTRTLRDYLQQPAFQAAYLARRKEAMAAAVALAQQHATDCVAVLLTIAKDKEMPPSARVSSANSVFSIADNGLKMEDLEVRIANLEEMFNEQLGKTPAQNGRANAFRTY